MDHEELSSVMKRLGLKMSDDRMLQLFRIVDPVGNGKVSQEALMYWLMPDAHSKMRAELGKRMSGDFLKGSENPKSIKKKWFEGK